MSMFDRLDDAAREWSGIPEHLRPIVLGDVLISSGDTR